MKKMLLVMFLILSVLGQSLALADGGRRSSRNDRRHDRYDRGHSSRHHHRDGRLSNSERDIVYSIVGLAAIATILDHNDSTVVVESSQCGHWEDRVVGYRTAYRLVRHPAEYDYVHDSRGRRHRVMTRPAWEEEIPYQVAVCRRVWVVDPLPVQ